MQNKRELSVLIYPIYCTCNITTAVKFQEELATLRTHVLHMVRFRVAIYNSFSFTGRERCQKLRLLFRQSRLTNPLPGMVPVRPLFAPLWCHLLSYTVKYVGIIWLTHPASVSTSLSAAVAASSWRDLTLERCGEAGENLETDHTLSKLRKCWDGLSSLVASLVCRYNTYSYAYAHFTCSFRTCRI